MQTKKIELVKGTCSCGVVIYVDKDRYLNYKRRYAICGLCGCRIYNFVDVQ